jgi:putative transposase
MLPNRQSNRLKGHDYSEPGCYFVTVCTREKQLLFGSVRFGTMHENLFGRIARRCWFEMLEHRDNIELGSFVVMPNHLHGIIKLFVPEDRLRPGVWRTGASLASIVGGFKAAVSRRITGESIWQRVYYDRVIRDQEELRRVSAYIEANPETWQFDSLHRHGGRGKPRLYRMIGDGPSRSTFFRQLRGRHGDCFEPCLACPSHGRISAGILPNA